MSQLTTATILHSMQEDTNPKREIFDAVGDLSDVILGQDNVLVGMYIQQGKTKSGLIYSRMSTESAYQGKVALILKMPVAGLNKAQMMAWNGNIPKVGDWVQIEASNGQQMSVCGHGAKRSSRLEELDMSMDGWPCRRIRFDFIEAILPNPRMIV